MWPMLRTLQQSPCPAGEGQAKWLAEGCKTTAPLVEWPAFATA